MFQLIMELRIALRITVAVGYLKRLTIPKTMLLLCITSNLLYSYHDDLHLHEYIIIRYIFSE